jgi:hypothetical protein
MDRPAKKRWPIFGVSCLVIALVPLATPFVINSPLAYHLEEGFQNSIPVIVLFLAVMAFESGSVPFGLSLAFYSRPFMLDCI